MFAKKQANFFTTILPLYVLLKIFSIFLPSFTGCFRIGNNLNVKIFDKLWFLTVYCLLMWLLFLNLYDNDKIQKHYSILIDRGYESCSIIGLSVNLITLPYYYVKADKIAEIFKSLYEFDEKVKRKLIFFN